MFARFAEINDGWIDHEFSLKLLIFSMIQYKDINGKTVSILFYLLIIQVTVYKRTIIRFIADDKFVYQQVRREMQVASDNSCAWRRLKHLSWRSQWTIMCTLEWRTAVSCEISQLIGAFLVCPPDWARGPPLLCTERGLPLPNCRTIVDYTSCRFSSADCRCFQVSNPCRAIHSTASVYHAALTDRDFWSEPHLPMKFSSFC